MTNTNTNTQPQYENHQIIRLDGKDKFVEILDTSFEIGKVIINFLEYDVKKQSGDRIKSNVKIYMDFAKFRLFANDILTGRFAALAQKKELNYLDLTGTSVERLKAQGRERPDGKAESRKLSLSPASKGFFFNAEKGPGEATETGLIKPAGKIEEKVSILITGDQSKQLALMTLAQMDAFISAKEVEKMLKRNGVIK